MDRRFLRPGWLAGHLLVLAAALTCLRLGWWQWERTQEATGTAQNFGYALLWPGFGVAFVYMWVRFLHLEVLKDAEDDEQTDRELRDMLAEGGFEPAGADLPTTAEPGLLPADERDALPRNGSDAEPVGDPTDPQSATSPRRRPDRQRPSRAVTISVATVGDADDDDPELTAYNQALAAMAEEDRRRAR